MEQMDFWYQTPPGSLVLEQEKRLLAQILKTLPGDVLIQINGLSNLNLVAASPIAHKIFMSLTGETSPETVSIKMHEESIPLMAGSVDVCVLEHALACSLKPQKLLADIYQCLAPGGTILIIGFNPWSFWNIARIRNKRYFPWSGYYYSCGRVNRWLRKCHYQIVRNNTFCFRLPGVSRQKWEMLSFIEPVGKLCFPGMGGLYIIMAQKKKLSGTPLLSKVLTLNKVKINNGGMAEPTTNVKVRHEKNTHIY